uniref:Uncharacterized protein n=1 Tax=Noctiluca scintillans TaxID=2966 RepID=A0A7S1FG66_NOCSC|mmetsp:Transcript_6080/g.17020  ORF Transcript_6080/g.17020 Transcript_6080/m.17020 type:complete len:549 (+) Transcript_6080:67-1713(+)
MFSSEYEIGGGIGGSEDAHAKLRASKLEVIGEFLDNQLQQLAIHLHQQLDGTINTVVERMAIEQGEKLCLLREQMQEGDARRNAAQRDFAALQDEVSDLRSELKSEHSKITWELQQLTDRHLEFQTSASEALAVHGLLDTTPLASRVKALEEQMCTHGPNQMRSGWQTQEPPRDEDRSSRMPQTIGRRPIDASNVPEALRGGLAELMHDIQELLAHPQLPPCLCAEKCRDDATTLLTSLGSSVGGSEMSDETQPWSAIFPVESEAEPGLMQEAQASGEDNNVDTAIRRGLRLARRLAHSNERTTGNSRQSENKSAPADSRSLTPTSRSVSPYRFKESPRSASARRSILKQYEGIVPRELPDELRGEAQDESRGARRVSRKSSASSHVNRSAGPVISAEDCRCRTPRGPPTRQMDVNQPSNVCVDLVQRTISSDVLPNLPMEGLATPGSVNVKVAADRSSPDQRSPDMDRRITRGQPPSAVVVRPSVSPHIAEHPHASVIVQPPVMKQAAPWMRSLAHPPRPSPDHPRPMSNGGRRVFPAVRTTARPIV